jgi:lipopolysaccharide biosynthesis regulator YciM
MSFVIVALLCLGIGFGVGWWYVLPRRLDRENFARRNRVLYELAEGDRENVAQELEQICASEPGDPTVFLALAALDRRRGRIERAKAVHRTVLASADLPSEQRVAALVGLGRDLLAEGNERAAVGALVRAVSLAPRSVATLETLARALERAGAWERAAAAWERLEKQVEGRRAQDARIGRGHAVAGQAVEALEDGEDRKARKLAERAVDLAPDSGHCWTVRARVESAQGDPVEALESWQRAWELSPVGARVVVPEAWEWASENRRQEDLMERMLSSLRMAREPQLVVALAEKVARQHAEQAASALERVAERSPSAQLALVRLRLARGQRELAREAAMRPPRNAGLLCGRCGTPMDRFAFRCGSCGAWDSASAAGEV